MIPLTRDTIKINAGHTNLNNLLMNRGWSVEREVDGGYYEDTYEKGEEQIVVGGILACEQSWSDHTILLYTKYARTNGGFVKSVVGLEDDFEFDGDAHYKDEETRKHYLRCFNDYIQFVHDITVDVT